MNNLLTITSFELKRIFRDKRLTLIVLSQPVVIALITGFLAYRYPTELNVFVHVEHSNPAVVSYSNALIHNERFNVVTGTDEAETLMKRGDLRAEITIIGQGEAIGSIEIKEDPTLGSFKAALEQPILQAFDGSENHIFPTIKTTDATNLSLHYFDYYASAIVSLLIILVVLNLSGISITSDRVQGTFERLAVTPYSKMDIIGGKAVAQAFIGICVAVLGLLSFHFLFHMVITNIWLIALINFLTVCTAVTMGLFISTITKSVVESVQLAMYTFFILFLTSGLNGPIEAVHPVFLRIMKATPIYYAVDASRRVNMLGASWHDVLSNIGMLCMFFIVFLILSMSLLRKEVK